MEREPVVVFLFVGRATLIGLVLALGGCLYLHDDKTQYPEAWPQVRQAQTVVDSCPDISGTYENIGSSAALRSGRVCDYSTECAVLNFNLTGTGQMVRRGSPPSPDPLHRLVIAQPSRAKLTVQLTDEGGTPVGELSELTRDADFTCDAGLLLLKARTNSLVLLVANAVTTESRKFFLASDDSLILQGDLRTVGNRLVFPVDLGLEFWVRWERAR